MFQIRRGVFETNSSSSHSITIGQEGNLTNFPMMGDMNSYPTLKQKTKIGKIRMTGSEFGWGVDQYNHFEMKFQYLITHIFGDCTDRDCVEKTMKRDSNFHMLKKVILKKCNLEIVPPDESAYKDQYTGPVGYIDHQSVGTASLVFESELILKCYLFDTDSTLYIDNDNH